MPLYTFLHKLLNVQLQISPFIILFYNGRLVTWTAVGLTVAKFKPLTFCMSGFALSHAANIFILMIFYDLRNVVTYSYTYGRCANRGSVCISENFQWCREPCFTGSAIPVVQITLFCRLCNFQWCREPCFAGSAISSGAGNLVLQALQFQDVSVANSQAV
jgi:hypothetical protein